MYCSKFLRDLCVNPELTNFVSEICGIDLLPHTMPQQLGHTNFNPLEVGKHVDKWHVDTLRFDFVMFVTNPNDVAGGEFQYFKGTKHEMTELHSTATPIPADKIVTPEFPNAGYAIMQQGNFIVHQAKSLQAVGERITMVNGYIAADPFIEDFTRYDQLTLVDPQELISAEYLRHVAIQARRQLEKGIGEIQFDTDNSLQYADLLEQTAAGLVRAAQQLRGSKSKDMEHFGT